MDHLNVNLAEVARGLRAVLDEIDDPDSELTASAAVRHRIEGTALALDAVVGCGHPAASVVPNSASALYAVARRTPRV